ncbi:MAG: hypothetical protein DRG83_02845, partial [Deltaproteobacteria bacterium]
IQGEVEDEVVLRPEAIRERLRELDRVLEELSQYRDRSVSEIEASLSLRWTIERELMAVRKDKS